MGITKGLRRLVLLLMLLAASPTAGQVATGSIIGYVYDRSGAVVAGAKLTLLDTATNSSRDATTSPWGGYEFLQLRPGIYDLSVDAKGFRHTVERSIVFDVGMALHLDVTVELGDVKETVEVKAAPSLIEPEKTSIGMAVDPRSVQSLPFQDRQLLNLALIVPGTIPGPPGAMVARVSVETFTTTGVRNQSNNYTLDGISNNDPHVNAPLNLFRMTDAVQEFDVETNIAGAEAGRNSGGQVSIITKSGSNDYHGTLFYYVRNDVFDATPYFLNRAGQPKNPLSRNQFGGTVGGFLFRDKTFWFFSFEGFRQTIQEPATARVPTDAERATVTDAVSQRLLQFWPHGNAPQLLPTTGTNWAGTTPDRTDDETYFGRIDQNLSKNHRLTGHLAWFNGSTLSLQTTPFNGLLTNAPRQGSFLLQETYATERLVNEARFGYSRNRALLLPADVALNPAAIFTDAAGKPLPGYIDTRLDPINGGLPTIVLDSFANGNLGADINMPQGRTTNTYEFLDDVSLLGPWGNTRHTLRFGVAARREIANLFLNTNFRGYIEFADWTAFASGLPWAGGLGTGAGGTLRTWSRPPVYLYGQDAFKLRSNLTINYGIRWEYPGAYTEKGNRGSNFIPGVGQMQLGSNLRVDVNPAYLGRAALVLTPVSRWLPASGQFSVPTRNFAPSLGVAYVPKVWPKLFGESKTVIRAGFRLSYDDIFDDIPTLMGTNPPAVLQTGVTGIFTWATVLNQNRSLFQLDPTVAGGERGILTFSAWDVNPSSPYAMNYALQIQRQIGKDFSIEASYIGTQGRHLGVFLDANQPTVTVNDPTVPGNQAPNVRVFPFPQYSNISQAMFVSNANFNGLLVVARKQAGYGLSFTASYEFSKSLDDNSSFLPTDGDTGGYADSHNRKLNYARSSFDVRQRVVASWVYELPLGPKHALLGSTHGFVGQLAGGWTLSGITSYRSGFPFTVFAGYADYTGFNGFSDWADLKPGVTAIHTNMSNPNTAFDPTVFTVPRAGRVGTAGRNSLIGPHFVSQDFAVLKDFPIQESKHLQFRAEFFNLFNHPNFQLPDSNLGDIGTVGKIGSSYAPRLIQLALRFQW